MKTKVQILTTPGCGGCARVEKMLDKMNVKYEVVDITKSPEILQKYPVMSAPGIVVDGRLVFIGVPKENDLRKAVKRS